MTKEELKKEAEEYFKSIGDDYNEEYERTGKRHYWVGFDIKNAYLAGAEPREKRIAELEHQLTHRNCLDCSNHSSKLRMRTLELEKENADLKEEINKIAFVRGNLEEENKELKHTIATLRQEKDNVSMHAKAMEIVAKTRSNQLTKATEIIKKLYAVYYDPCVTESDLKYRDELFAEIKQFLNG